MRWARAGMAALVLVTSPTTRASECPFESATPIVAGEPAPCTGFGVSVGALGALAEAAKCGESKRLLGGCEEARRLETEAAREAQKRCEASLFACERDYAPLPPPPVPKRDGGVPVLTVVFIGLAIATIAAGGTALAYELR